MRILCRYWAFLSGFVIAVYVFLGLDPLGKTETASSVGRFLLFHSTVRSSYFNPGHSGNRQWDKFVRDRQPELVDIQIVNSEPHTVQGVRIL